MRVLCIALVLFLASLTFVPSVAAEVTDWQTTSTVIPVGLSNAASATYQSGSTSFTYIIGGHDGSNTLDTVYYANISGGKTDGSWQTGTTLPQALTGATAQVYQAGTTAYLYVMAGRNSSNTGQTTVYYATINKNTGALGSWTTNANALPAGLLSPTSAIYQSATSPFLYVIGGQNNGFSNTQTTYYASIIPSTGAVGSWSTSSNNLPAAVNKAASVSFSPSGGGMYIYVLGGSGSSTALSSVYYTSINTTTGDIAAWTTSSNTLTTALFNPAAVIDTTVTNPVIYIFGGKNNSSVTQSAGYYASINASTGAVGSWSTSVNSLPQGVFNPSWGTFRSDNKSYFYVIGGQDTDSNPLRLVYSANTSLVTSGNIQVDYTSKLRDISPIAFGVDETAYNEGFYLTNDARNREKIKNLKPQIMRMGLKYNTSGNPNSGIVCEALGCDTSITGTEWINAIKSVNALPMIMVPLNSTDAANLVTYFNRTTNNYVKYWIVYNEPNNQGVSGADYSSSFNTIYDAMKAVDSSIEIGGPALSFLDTDFMETFLTTSGSRADFIIFHKYAEQGTTETEATLFSEGDEFDDEINTLRNLILINAPSRISDMEISIGEWYLNAAPGDPKIYQNFNLVWTASTLGKIIKSGALSNIYGTKDNLLFPSDNSTYSTKRDDPMPAYHGYGMFTGEAFFRSFGSKIVSANTTLSNIEVYASDNPKNIVVINKSSSTTQSGTFQLAAFGNGYADVWQKNNSMNAFADPVNVGRISISNDSFSYSLPPYSVTTFELTNTDTAPPQPSFSNNFPPGWKYPIDAGPNRIGPPLFKTQDGGFTYFPNNASTIDVSLKISKKTFTELSALQIPVPWSQGVKVVGEPYLFEALSSFNGYPVTPFQVSVLIGLPFNAAQVPKNKPTLKIFRYDGKRWRATAAPLVMNLLNQTLATTVKEYGYFVVGHY